MTDQERRERLKEVDERRREMLVRAEISRLETARVLAQIDHARKLLRRSH